MSGGPQTMTYEEWFAEGEKRFGKDRNYWKFVCPSCGHVAAAHDWFDADAPAGAVGFSCVGRWTGAGAAATFKKAGGPCNYAGGGLFKLNPIAVIDAEGKEHHVFEFAEAAKMEATA